ncbi:hypothetical protein BDY17DRAFT_303439 [Neohortaea acidophila]|uniref:Uncharacterized protein n=1 Tax=Neohortaea acidophila TaxID=245834 RepID=A0A6A6PLT3_9PEZI|nr:uncharacterized protein BDY17DRAFT_303439 [Neohortaea acidophila]KAF2480217.1 hypothetical protein BDY17DRAFT_303439 [Neohortaea acidophila]
MDVDVEALEQLSFVVMFVKTSEWKRLAIVCKWVSGRTGCNVSWEGTACMLLEWFASRQRFICRNRCPGLDLSSAAKR